MVLIPKRVFSKEVTKSTKFKNKISVTFVSFVLLSMRVFAACANFPGAEDPSDSDMPRAKTLSDRPKACHPERMRGI